MKFHEKAAIKILTSDKQNEACSEIIETTAKLPECMGLGYQTYDVASFLV